MWQSDPCYASYGVDGSECSFLMYLSEVGNSSSNHLIFEFCNGERERDVHKVTQKAVSMYIY